MKALWLLMAVTVLSVSACREANQFPNVFTDGGVVATLEDAGPIPDGAIGSPCPCHPDLTEVLEGLGDGGTHCVCRRPCEPGQPVPRCVGWEYCAILRRPLGDGGGENLDAGVCISASGPDMSCSSGRCGETLICADRNQDAGLTCRYLCQLTPPEDGGALDAEGMDAIPLPGECPPAQRCFAHPNIDGGICFVP